MTGFNVTEWVEILEKAQFAHVTLTDTSATNLLSSDVSEDRVLIPLSFVFSDQTGSANTIDIRKVEEDDTKTDIHPNFNLGASETVIVTMDEFAPLVPRLEGGCNLELQAEASNIEATMVFVNNVEL